MSSSQSAYWTDHLRHTLESYGEPLLREVAGKLFKPRNQWPAAELIDRSLATVANAAVIDRRLRELPLAGRRLLGLISRSRQPRWPVGGLLEILAALGHVEGIDPLMTLFTSGLLYPDLSTPRPPTAKLRAFEHWLGQSSVTEHFVFAHPAVTARLVNEDLGLPDLAREPAAPVGPVMEADGLEWLLRLAALWQQVADAPLRRTQQGDFFKRDLDRLRADPLLNATSPDNLAELPDASLLAVLLALALGILREQEGEIQAADLPESWEEGLTPALASLWETVPRLESWDPQTGWRVGTTFRNPYPTAYLLSLLLLARLPVDSWIAPETVAEWIVAHHPYWTTIPGSKSAQTAAHALERFLLGFAYPARWLQVGKGEAGEWLVRLSSFGRWLLDGAAVPELAATFPRTLYVQPNLEIVAYRQGLTPALIVELSRFAAWTGLSSACTLQLRPETVYRALEMGQTFDTICQTLERHGMRELPRPVIDSLRTWADKRERITVYPSATLFEFASAEDLNAALNRGLPGARLTDRLAVVPRESEVDFRHFRLTGTRDYGLAPDKCIEVADDGVTLSIDLARSDLLAETELRRFAEPCPEQRSSSDPTASSKRHYRMTPASLAAARSHGFNLRQLEDWFAQRSDQPLPAAARLLLLAAQMPPGQLRRQLVLTVASPELADGLQQWPETRHLIQDRLGPMTLAVAEEHGALLLRQIQALGMDVRGDALDKQPSSNGTG